MIVVTDLEGTLTSGETWRGLTDYLREHGRGGAVWRFLLPYLPMRVLARLGLRRNTARDRLGFMESLTRLMAGSTEADWAVAADWVAEHALWPARYAAIVAELEEARRAGARVIICSGAYQPLVEAVARKAGFEAIGTPLVWKDGYSTGRVDGPFTFGRQKADRLIQYLGGVGIDRAYGDTTGDIEMLALAREGVIIDHDPALRREAETRGWRILTDSQARAVA